MDKEKLQQVRIKYEQGLALIDNANTKVCEHVKTKLSAMSELFKGRKFIVKVSVSWFVVVIHFYDEGKKRTTRTKLKYLVEELNIDFLGLKYSFELEEHYNTHNIRRMPS
jgi:hypothetical protein